MSWMEQLVQTYNENEQFAGKVGAAGMKALLPPIGHIVQNAQIEMTLSGDGRLIHAEVVSDKGQQPTLIPCTPDSASRTCNLSPHPLHNNLFYIARDYHAFIKEETSEQECVHKQYVKLLRTWAESKYSDPKVCAVYRYVTEHDVIHDLIVKNILYCDEKGAFLTEWTDKTKAKPSIFKVSPNPLKAMVRFRVELNGDSCPDLWRDTKLQEKYRAFFRCRYSSGENSLCYASGKMMSPARKHAKGIRRAGDQAKLISSNDTDGFTYRGRFANADECLTIGDETSQKAMNALKWLIRNQGYQTKKDDSFVFLAWGRCAREIPSVFDDTEHMMRRRRAADSVSQIPATMKEWAKSLHLALDGYRADFRRAKTSQVNVMILDAATKGRLSICYYDEMAGEDFIERIGTWHGCGCWRQHRYDEKEKAFSDAFYFGVPTPKRLVEACYGENISDKQRRMALERIFYAIVQGRILPRDMEKTVHSRTVKRSAVEKYDDWRGGLLEPACSIICNRLNHTKEEYTVALDERKRDRSYLYGRLLAVADQIERSTFDTEDLQRGRTTNAMRFMDRFSNRPASTWGMLRKKLVPYQQKIERYGGKERRLLDEICSLFDDEDFISNTPLNVKFLLGFSCQSYALEMAKAKHKKKADEKKNAGSSNHADDVPEDGSV